MPREKHREKLIDDEVEAQIEAALPDREVRSTLSIPDAADGEPLPPYDAEPEAEEGKGRRSRSG
jgi:hypothetical protein